MLGSSYYTELYCFLLGEDTKPVGAGFCIDGQHIVTCAHVVNASWNRTGRLDKTDRTVFILFPGGGVHSKRRFECRLICWGWEDLEQAELGFLNQSILIANDLAVLKIIADTAELELLQGISESAKFLKGDLKNNRFDAYSLMPGDNESTAEIFGTIAGIDLLSRVFILQPAANVQNYFFDSGSSGSPVFSSIISEGEEIASGIAGFVSYLNSDKGKSDARMIPVSSVEKICLKAGVLDHLNIIDVDKKRLQLKARAASDKIFARRGYEIHCDRQQIIDKIAERLAPPKKLPNAFLLMGDDQQRFDCFIDRYDLEFIAGKGLESSRPKVFQMPEVTKLELFSARVLGAFLWAFGYPSKRFADPDHMTIQDIIDELLLDENLHYLLECKIDNDALVENFREVYEWFFKGFLGPFRKNRRIGERLHFFVSFSYRKGTDCEANKRFFIDLFDEFELPELEDVSREDVEIWLEFAYDIDFHSRQWMMDNYYTKSSYTMAEIVNLFKEANSKINIH